MRAVRGPACTVDVDVIKVDVVSWHVYMPAFAPMNTHVQDISGLIVHLNARGPLHLQSGMKDTTDAFNAWRAWATVWAYVTTIIVICTLVLFAFLKVYVPVAPPPACTHPLATCVVDKPSTALLAFRLHCSLSLVGSATPRACLPLCRAL